jgi:hypothetical protein
LLTHGEVREINKLWIDLTVLTEGVINLSMTHVMIYYQAEQGGFQPPLPRFLWKLLQPEKIDHQKLV